jgi:hypothetical protein
MQVILWFISFDAIIRMFKKVSEHALAKGCFQLIGPPIFEIKPGDVVSDTLADLRQTGVSDLDNLIQGDFLLSLLSDQYHLVAHLGFRHIGQIDSGMFEMHPV